MNVSQRSEMNRDLASAMTHSSGSFELVIGASASALAGWGLDSLFGTGPLFLLVFAIVGFIGAAYSLFVNYRTTMSAESARRDHLATGAQPMPTALTPNESA